MNGFKKIFFDTSPLIYFLDANSIFKSKMDNIFYEILNNEIQFVTSAVTVEEFLVFPYRNEDDSAIESFWTFINEGNVNVIKIDNAIAIEAAKIRAEYRHIKTADALQLAAAVCSGCDVFLTNDKQLKQFEKISCVTVDEWTNFFKT